MIEKDEYIREAKATYSEPIQEKLLKLYEIYATDSKEDLESTILMDDILNCLFNPTGIYKEPMIPLSFLKTTVGRVVVSVMGDKDNRMYTINDIIAMSKTEQRPLGYTHQYLSQEIKAGRLKAVKDGSRWMLPHSEAIRFLRSKGIL